MVIYKEAIRDVFYQQQLYIGDGTLVPNQTYTVIIAGLLSRDRTVAFINNVQVPVNYLVTVDEPLNVTLLNGELYVGGYGDVSMLKVGFFCIKLSFFIQMNIYIVLYEYLEKAKTVLYLIVVEG